MSERKYGDLVYTFVPEVNNWGDFLPPTQLYFRGEKNIPGATFFAPFRPYMAPVFLDKEPHYHKVEEYLTFVGADIVNAYESFDAEIEFWIGEDVHNMEKYIITSPTIIRVPAGIWHCPLEFKRVDKPLFFQPALLSGVFGAYKLETDDAGNEQIVYSEMGAKKCVEDPSINCKNCGKCYRQMLERNKNGVK